MMRKKSPEAKFMSEGDVMVVSAIAAMIGAFIFGGAVYMFAPLEAHQTLAIVTTIVTGLGIYVLASVGLGLVAQKFQ